MIAALFLIMIASGVSVAASPDISGMLKEWFQGKSDDAITEIDNTVNKELDRQTARLKENLGPVIDSAEKDINTNVQQEKQKAKKKLRDYADQLIEKHKSNQSSSSSNNNAYEQRLDSIVKQAVSKMANVKPETDDKPKPDNKPESDNEDGSESEDESKTDEDADNQNESAPEEESESDEEDEHRQGDESKSGSEDESDQKADAGDSDESNDVEQEKKSDSKQETK
ncbi:hypothetical protein [Lentibacillus kimchii]